MGLEKPGLHQVAGAYHNERREIVHMSDGHRGGNAAEEKKRRGTSDGAQDTPVRRRAAAFRQPRAGDWVPVIQNVVAALARVSAKSRVT